MEEDNLDIIINGAPIFIEVVMPEQINVDLEVPLIAELEFDVLSDWQAPYNYMGKAYAGSAQDDAVWTITRIQVAADGTATTLSASNVKWSERTTIIYA